MPNLKKKLKTSLFEIRKHKALIGKTKVIIIRYIKFNFMSTVIVKLILIYLILLEIMTMRNRSRNGLLTEG